MKRWTRLCMLALAVVLVLGIVVPARADVMTLGVYLRGLMETENGTTEKVPVSGAFRVLQGGLEAGTIRAGEETLNVSGSGPVTLEPLPETFDAGWDLSDARVTVDMTTGSVTVPIFLPRLTEETVAAVPVTEAPQEETPAETAAPEEDDIHVEDLVETATVAAAVSLEPVATPVLAMTPVPTAEVTAVPDFEVQAATADTGAFRIQVFEDKNSNGEQGNHEEGIAGVGVYIVDEDGTAVTGGETGETGEITLGGLTPGTYKVRVILPEEWCFSRQSSKEGLDQNMMGFWNSGTQDSTAITVSAGETVERGVGLQEAVSVSGTVWLDEDGDGVMEDGEPKVAGAHITLSGQKNGLVFEVYTDANGDWLVTNMRPGFYDLTGYAPDGMMFTRYSKTGGKNRSVFTAEGKTKQTKALDMNDGQSETDQNIGFTWTGSVSGICWLDANYNGLYDEGELPFAGVKVTAIKENTGEEIAVVYSGEDGKYTLSGLRGNTYTIRAVLPDDGSNFTVTVDDTAGNHYQARDNRRENFLKGVTIADGGTYEVNVGAIYYGSVSGTVYEDDDFSATLSGGEKVTQGIVVTLLDESGNTVDQKKTTAKGVYSFTGLVPGKYSLKMTAKTGYAFTKLGDGNIMLNLTGGEGYSEAFDVPLGTDVTGKDAGMIRPATVRGTVYADTNDNGTMDSGETGMVGATVRLISAEGEAAFEAVIGEDGAFLFDAVMPGEYALNYMLPADTVFATGNTVTGENGTATGETFTIKTADVIDAPVCGALTLGRISGTVFEDHNGSGSQDTDDQTLSGAVITLTPSRTDLTEVTVTTAEDGSFLIENIRPDTYKLRVTLPDGRVTGRVTGTTLPVSAGKNDQTADLAVAMGAQWTGQSIGAVIPARLSGQVWLDENNDGKMDEGEQTPSGYIITLTDEETNSVFANLATDENGYFGIEGLVPGTFTVTYTLDDRSDAAPDGDSTFTKAGNQLTMTGIPLTEGEEKTDLKMGVVRYTELGGKVWVDRGEQVENLSGAEVSLLNENGETLSTVTTGEDGTWRFDGLMPGTFRILAKLPEGIVAVEPDDERLETGLISVVQETDGREGKTDLITVRMAQDQLSLNIGGVLPGTIGDYCWLDENGNGWQDGGEYGVPHVKVELVRNGETVAGDRDGPSTGCISSGIFIPRCTP